MRKLLFLSLLLPSALCVSAAEEKLIILDEGLWQTDNGRLSYFCDGEMVSNQWFRDINGYKLGDTPNDIIQVRENLIAIAVNWSNIIQFISADGKAVGATENIPNVRCLASDGHYVYATSYGHECETETGTVEFEKGFVAKIDPDNYSVVAACEVGYEPEGIAYYDGKLFIANTGGYAFQENHEYESTLSIVDSSSMTVSGRIDTGCINLYGQLSRNGKYLCVNSVGDYYEVEAATIIVDCEKALMSPETCFTVIPYAATYSTPGPDETFFAIGSRFSFLTGESKFNCLTINPEKVIESHGKSGIEEILPGSMDKEILSMEAPYGIYRNPYTGMLYATDAGAYSDSGSLYQFSPEGKYIGKFTTYINPGGFLALRPDSMTDLPETVDMPRYEEPLIYDINGRRVSNPQTGSIYIVNGRKMVFFK